MSAPVPASAGRGASAARLERILRVDQAGELGAVHIYRGQRAVMSGSPRHLALAARLGVVEAQEAAHLAHFDALLTQVNARPTLLAPLWRVAGFALGVGTALMGERAVHACTEAVESVIEQHYADQIEALANSAPGLAAELSGFRDDELAHRDDAVARGARAAPGYGLLSILIRAGCRAAIAVSERV